MMKKIGVMITVAVCALSVAHGQTQAASGSAARDAVVTAIKKYKVLNDFFPYGVWFADACYCESYCQAMSEPYPERRGKIFQDFARHYVNTIVPSNRDVRSDYLDTMAYYGQRCVSTQNFLTHAQPLVKGQLDRTANLDPAQLKKVQSQWAEYIAGVKDHPALLAWHVFDEPEPVLSPTIQKVVEFIEQQDPAHPVLYTHQNLPLGSYPTELDLIKSLPVIYSDCYCLSEAFGFDPWLYGDVAMAEFRRVNPQALNWPTIQAFDYGGKLPTVGELRVMIYHTIGCGAKGMFFFTPEQAGITWEAPGLPVMFNGLGNAWFAEDALWAEIGRIGYYLTAAGPLLVDLQYQPNYVHQVATATFTTKIDAKKIKLRKDVMLTMPAIHVGAFVGRDFDVLVINNDNPFKPGEGTVSIPVRAGKNRVYDLYDLAPVATQTVRNHLRFKVKFEPGDGRLYLVGDTVAFSQASQTVRRHRYGQQALLLKLDLDLARKGKVAVQAADVLVAQAAGQAEKSDFAAALKTLVTARETLVQAESQSPEYSKMKALLETLRQDFTAIDDNFKSRNAKKIPAAWKNTMIALTQKFSKLENEFRAGTPNLPEAEAVAKSLTEFKPLILVPVPPK